MFFTHRNFHQMHRNEKERSQNYDLSEITSHIWFFWLNEQKDNRYQLIHQRFSLADNLFLFFCFSAQSHIYNRLIRPISFCCLFLREHKYIHLVYNFAILQLKQWGSTESALIYFMQAHSFNFSSSNSKASITPYYSMQMALVFTDFAWSETSFFLFLFTHIVSPS